MKEMKQFVRKHRVAAGMIGGLGAFTVAAVYYFLVPVQAPTPSETGMRIASLHIHSLSWLLLSVSSLMYAANLPKDQIRRVAQSSLGAYLLFIVILIAT